MFHEVRLSLSESKYALCWWGRSMMKKGRGRKKGRKKYEGRGEG
jgi:hypothetical protein